MYEYLLSFISLTSCINTVFYGNFFIKALQIKNKVAIMFTLTIHLEFTWRDWF